MKFITGNRENNKTKIWFSEKINKIDKPLVKLTKRKKGHKLLISETKGRISLQTLQKLKG